MSQKDYYEVLNIDKNCSDGEIKKAYRQAAIKWHPDRNQNDPEAEKKFKEASEAYEVLSDPQKKAIYDQYGHAGLSGQGYQGFSNVDDIFQNFGSIFEDFFGFGRGSSRGRVQYGADLKAEVDLEFKDAVFGVKKDITFFKRTGCDNCSQTGCEPGTHKTTCNTCGGMGQVRRSQGFFSIATTCPTCGGVGQEIESPCRVCKGNARVKVKKTLALTIPAGIQNGMQLKLSGEGDEGPNNGPAGDLYVYVNIKEDSRFEREENDILMNQKISFAQAALGTELVVETLDGEETVRIPAGSQHDQTIKITGKGVPFLNKKTRGDFFVILKIDVPKKLSAQQKKLLEEYAAASGDKITKSSSGFFKNIFE